MRRKTSDEQLAKRAKKLVRSWQKVVSGTSESNTSINGGEIAGGGTAQGRPQGQVKKPVSPAVAQGKPVNRPVNPNSVNSSLSSRQPNSKPSTPQLDNVKHSAGADSSKRSISSPQLAPPGSAKRFCISPNSKPHTPQTPNSASSQITKQCLPQDKSWAVRPTTPSTTSKASSTSTSRSVTPSIVVTDSKTIRRTHSSENLKRGSSPVRTVHSTGDLTLTIRTPTNGEQNGCVKPSRSKEHNDYSKALEAAGLRTEIAFKPVINGTESTPLLEPTPKRKRGRPRKYKLDPSPEEAFSKKYMSKSASTSKISKLSKSFSEKRNVNLGIKTEFDTSSKDKFVSLTPKVKSTAELIQVLQAKNSLSVGKDTVHQIEANLIRKEHDAEELSVVPASAKPRPRRKPGTRTELIPPSTPVSLQTKTEMVEKFLQTSVNETPDDLSPIKFELPRTESPSASTSLEDVSEHPEAAKLSTQKNRSSPAEWAKEQIKSESVIKDESKCDSAAKDKAGVTADKQLSLDEIYSKYPVLDLDNFVFDSGEYDIAEALEINDDVVSRIHSEHWTGVNGVYDAYGDWRDWTQTLSLDSFQGDPIHILPYVNVDD